MAGKDKTSFTKKEECELEEKTAAEARQRIASARMAGEDKPSFTKEQVRELEERRIASAACSYRDIPRRMRTAMHLDPTQPLVPYQYYLYPIKPRVAYEQVVADPGLFFSTLEELHSAMRTTLTAPSLGGVSLDLHKLFVKVTSAGGANKVDWTGKWKEVAAVFDFLKFVENAHVELRKYYLSSLYHYEKVYFIRADIFAVIPEGSYFPEVTIPILALRLAGVTKGVIKLPEGTIVPGYNGENAVSDCDEWEGGIEAN